MKRALLPVAVCLAAMPSVVSADIFKPSVKQQIELGQKAADQVRKKERVLSDRDERVRVLRRVAGKLMLAMPEKEREQWQFSFDVIDSKDVNAFALPGGPIFFYTGLLDKLKTEDELAGILGHEIVHVRNQHWASAYADTQKRRLGLSAILMLIRAKDIVWDLASIGDDLIFGLPYSRSHETEADRIGMKNMIDAGYNPNGMADVFRMLGSQGSKPPEFLSTHPDDRNRVNRIESDIAKLGRSFPAMRPLPWAR